MTDNSMKIIVAITGASGTEIGIRTIEELKKSGVEVYTVVSDAAKMVMKYESKDLDASMKRIEANSRKVYGEKDIAAPIASGSFKVDGMIVVPCSMKTLASIACGFSNNLITRAADVQLKQKRRLVLVPREAPLNSIHLENMLKLSNLGVWIMPPMMCFYNKPKTVDDMVSNTVGRILDAFEIENKLYKKWGDKQ